MFFPSQGGKHEEFDLISFKVKSKEYKTLFNKYIMRSCDLFSNLRSCWGDEDTINN